MQANVSGHKIGYEVAGEGMPVVFLHAFPLNKSMWVEQVSALKGKYRAITIDLRGFGESSPVEDIYRVEQMAADIHGLMSELSIGSATVVGLSMGGYAAFALYKMFPASISGLVLANTRATADSPEGREKRIKSAARAEAEGAEVIVDEMIPLLIGNKSAQSDGDLVARVRRIARTTSAATIARAQLGMAERPDSTSVLGTIDKPVLVIGGTDDAIIKSEEVEAMASRVPGSRLHMMKDVGHLSNLERPNEFNDALVEFLGRMKDEG